MTYSIDVVVTEVIIDFDKYGGEYVKVALAYKLPSPFKPPIQRINPMIPQPPVEVYYKHALHVLIPRDRWKEQFNMWREYHLIVKDDGSVELKPKR